MWKYMDTLESRVNITCTYTNSNESNDSRHACCVSNDVYTELSDSLYGPGHLAYLNRLIVKMTETFLPRKSILGIR